MINVLFFAQVRELIGQDHLTINPPPETAEALRQQLCEQHPKWALALQSDKLLVAINQRICPLNSPLKEGDEVAFFPPVTGG